MKNTFTFLIMILCMTKFFAQQPSSLHIPKKATIDSLLVAHKVPAIAIGIIEKGKNPIYITRGKNHENTFINEQTIFDVASLTKTITTLITLQLISTDALQLDEPLYKYYVDPDIKQNPLHKELTVRHVLSHRTGFKNWRWMREDKKLAFDFAPGEKFQYSGEGFEYLRKALENKFNTSFEQLADSLVFRPYGMKNSALVWSQTMEAKQFAGTHDASAKPYVYEKEYQANAADNLLTTVEDLSMLAMHILNKEELNTAVYNEMISSQSNVREGINFGLGWIIFNNLPNDEYALFNAGSDKGVNSLIVLLPKSKRALIVMTNGDNGRGLAMKLVAEVLRTPGKEILSRF